MNKSEADKIIRSELKKGKRIAKVEGAFGDKTPNIAFIENISEQGTKFYFCSYLYKGNLDSELHDRVTIVKRILMETARQLLRFPYFILLPVVLFDAKRWILWFTRIYEGNLYQFIQNGRGGQLTTFPKEILEAGHRAVKFIPTDCENEEESFRYKVFEIFHWLAYTVFSDFAYYTRIQDPLSELDKDNLKKNPRKEIIRLLKIAVSREVVIKQKTEIIAIMAWILLLNPFIKKLITSFLMELNLENVCPDGNDTYFSFRRYGYNALGLPYEERIKLVREIDERMGHFIYE